MLRRGKQARRYKGETYLCQRCVPHKSPVPAGRLKSLNVKFPNLLPAGCESKCRPVASATAIHWSRKATGPACNTRAYPVMKSSGSWMPSARASRNGNPPSALAWAGMAAIAAIAMPCRSGDFFGCTVALQITGISFDGGYADYMVAPAIALALVPTELSTREAAPLMCAGITTYNALRNSGARPGDVVAVLGLGGLGHLGVQYAVKMGFKTVGIARGQDKAPLARKLGAHHYIDSQAQDPAAELQKLGGAKVILATVTNGDAMGAVQGGLGLNGMLVVVGAAQSLQVSPLVLIGGRRSVKGWYSGTALDSQDTLKFSVLSGVRSMNEEYPLGKVAEAYERMMSGKARFRVVLTMGQ